MAKWVYLFEEGNADMRNLLGGKGANLAEMTNLGLPIPQGFTVTTEACTDYYNNGRKISDEIKEQIFTALAGLEQKQGKKFGDTENPLLVSVRSRQRIQLSVLGMAGSDEEGIGALDGGPDICYNKCLLQDKEGY